MTTTATNPGAIDTRRVTGRRSLRFNSVPEMLADAERLAAGPHRTLGNWTLGQILGHIANGLKMGVDGADQAAPWPVRVVVRTFFMKRMLQRGFRPGFKLPQRVARKIVPPPLETDEGLRRLRDAVDRWQREPQRAMHPLFGQITPEQWEQSQLRHAELHLSFVVPEAPAE